ncbi:hypothetical protein BDZ90DRAFT_232474 [Jaminaea rosea]|uniref:P-loop containing nucleoside triphosphate hydrolase protein n=1 Tax=Jaminaea rosea TaxID=1569628 RepID=A0A316UUC1_9BASI|nr:hypothetical protein BDZ90DRAFT_232474 [Jaminaea rosea]PWN27503.1 hypothetical protein BDZ90DRAFT_232474 [Jaminaea rosea]
MFHLLSSLYTDLTTRPRFNILFLGGPSSGKTSLLAVLKEEYVEPPKQRGEAEGSGMRRRRQQEALPRTRPTVGQNVLDIVAPSLPEEPMSEDAEGSSSALRGLQQIWPRPPAAESLPSSPSVASTSKGGWFSSSSPSPATLTHQAVRTTSVLHIWDLGGDPSLRPIWREYYKEAHAVIYFWDVASAQGREDEWETLRTLSEEGALRGKPVLVVLSRGDRGAASGKEGRTRGGRSAEGDGGATLSPQEEHEEGDLSLSMDDPRRSGLDGIITENDAAAEEARPTAPDHADQKPDDASKPAGTAATLLRSTTQDDVLESLKAFIESHIEAHVVEEIGNASVDSSRSANTAKAGGGDGAAQKVEGGDGGAGEEQGGADEAEDDADDEGSLDDEGPPQLFPPTTLLPLSLVEGYGERDVMRWMIARSLEAAKARR